MTVLSIANGYQVYTKPELRSKLVKATSVEIPAWSELEIEGIDPFTIKETLKHFEGLKKYGKGNLYSLSMVTALFNSIIQPYEKGLQVSAPGMLRFEVTEKGSKISIISDQNIAIHTDPALLGVNVAKLGNEMMKGAMPSHFEMRNISSLMLLDIDETQLKGVAACDTKQKKIKYLNKAFNKRVPKPYKFILDIPEGGKLVSVSTVGSESCLSLQKTQALRIRLIMEYSQKELRELLLKRYVLLIPAEIQLKVTGVDADDCIKWKEKFGETRLPNISVYALFQSAISPYAQEIEFNTEGDIKLAFSRDNSFYTIKPLKHLTVLPHAPTLSCRLIPESRQAIKDHRPFKIDLAPGHLLCLKSIPTDLLQGLKDIQTDQARLIALLYALSAEIPKNTRFYLDVQGKLSFIPKTDDEGSSEVMLSSTKGLTIELVENDRVSAW